MRLVLMHRPGDELNVIDTSKRLDDIGAFGDPETGLPPLAALQADHDRLVTTLQAEGVEVVFLDQVAPGRMKSCYTRDSA